MPWSGSRLWGYGSKLGLAEAREAFDAAVAGGVHLFDSAEIYGFGKSERAIGQILRERETDGVVIATKYAPLPLRFSPRAFHRALDRSLKRLGLPSVDLYQIHFPGGRIDLATLMHAMADALDDGRIQAAGVSNYNESEMRRAAKILESRGHRLASNQVEYSLVHRTPEGNGVLGACTELGVTLLAYSPLGRGLLTGKYRSGNAPIDWRKRIFTEEKLALATPLLDAIATIANAHGVSSSQIALNWLARIPAVLPIPGAKNAAQAASNAEALSFELTDEEDQRLRQLSTAFMNEKSFGQRA